VLPLPRPKRLIIAILLITILDELRRFVNLLLLGLLLVLLAFRVILIVFVAGIGVGAGLRGRATSTTASTACLSEEF
jgi:hypothetical protein